MLKLPISPFQQTRFTCKATMTEVTPNRKWYYITCPHYPKNLFLQTGEIPKFECEDDGTIAEPTFMYGVNTTIADETMDAKAVFFNEAMTEMVDKLQKHGCSSRPYGPIDYTTSNPRLKRKTCNLQKDNTMTINKVTKSTTFTPTTLSKRKSQHPAGPETPSKQPKT